MDLDVNIVIRHLGEQIGELSVQLAIAKTEIETLRAQIQEVQDEG